MKKGVKEGEKGAQAQARALEECVRGCVLEALQAAVYGAAGGGDFGYAAAVAPETMPYVLLSKQPELKGFVDRLICESRKRGLNPKSLPEGAVLGALMGV